MPGALVASRRSGVGGRRSEVEGRRSEVGGPRSEVEGRRSEVGDRRSGIWGRGSKAAVGHVPEGHSKMARDASPGKTGRIILMMSHRDD